MALLLPIPRYENRLVFPIAILFVSLLGSVASAECGDHLKSNFHQFWPERLINVSQQDFPEWPELAGLRSRTKTLDNRSNKTPPERKVCWSCRGATPTSQPTISPSEIDQPTGIVGSTENSPTIQFSFGVPKNHSVKTLGLPGPLLRPPIV